MFKQFLIGCITFMCIATLFGCDRKKPEEKKKETTVEETSPSTPEGLTREQAAKVVARVGDVKITVGDLTKEINRLSPYIRRRWAAPERRKEFLQKMIQIELLSQEAGKIGLDKSPKVQRAMQQVMIRLLVKNDLNEELLPEEVDEELLKESYNEQWNKYHQPQKYRIAQILVPSEAEAKRLISEIEKQEKPEVRFRELAREVSIDEASSKKGGDVGYVLNPKAIEKSKESDNPPLEQNPDIEPQVAEAAWKFKKKNEFSKEPVKTEKGYHILMLTNIKPPMNRSYKSVKRLLENRMLRKMRKEKMNEFIDSLRKKAEINIFEERLDKIDLDVDRKAKEKMKEKKEEDKTKKLEKRIEDK